MCFEWFHRLPLLAIVGLTLSCNSEDAVGPLTGSLAITTTTTGNTPDADGYTVQIDTEQPSAIGAAATLQISDIVVGDHTVLLGGLASNCTVAGENPRTVIITADVTEPISFDVTCAQAVGTVEVVSARVPF
jgi:hypothetical protein